jgi:hypothetical protein
MTTGDEAEPTDADVVRTAADAAEALVFSRLDRAAVDDLDVTVTFEDRVLEIDVYLHAPDADADADQIADDAARAGQAAVDELLE